MKAAFLIKNGKAQNAFEVRETSIAEPAPIEVQIEVEGFGLNFADVMARLGLYPDAPKKPGVLGYDVVGRVVKKGADVGDRISVGDRVVALTRFGGYAEFANTDVRGVVKISEDTDMAEATALATQAGTAYYMIEEMVSVFPGDRVLVHAAAGGVGSILCQMAKARGAIVFGTASSPEKLEYLKSIGVDYPINYKSEDFETAVANELSGKKLDVLFDAVGGRSVKKGMRLLGAGGRIVLYGASALTSAKNIFSKIGVAIGFGLYSPLAFLDPSKSMIAVNMLRIADDKPEVLNRVLEGTVKMYEEGIIKPQVGGVYPISELSVAHEALETRKTMGKIAITWT